VFVTVAEGSGPAPTDPVADCLTEQRKVYLPTNLNLVDAAGEQRAVAGSVSPVQSPGGVLEGAVLIFRDETLARRRQHALEYSAQHDVLTGLPNRAAFNMTLQDAIETAQMGRTHALCLLDLDLFKPVNDGSGHAAGDALLAKVATAIVSACRANDLVARIGGDEFALLLLDSTIAGAESAASIGITAINGRATSATRVVNEADFACYAAKAAGGNRVAVHGADTRVRDGA
jgi:GGDEF domain-containing protein